MIHRRRRNGIDAIDHNGDVEGQVRGVGIGAAAQDAAYVATRATEEAVGLAAGGQELNLAEIANRA